MNRNSNDGFKEYGYQPQPEERGYQPDKINDGYNPSSSPSSAPPNVDSCIQPAKKDE